ncbi:MAG: hypothetical protein IKK39_09155 [Thermoguttaceae bacterium]|nr:hypothetical protein [Thermoguttaceae bacterium]MBR4104211.1 hypothetical protein [Thermoguttaceae bacterium]
MPRLLNTIMSKIRKSFAVLRNTHRQLRSQFSLFRRFYLWPKIFYLYFNPSYKFVPSEFFFYNFADKSFKDIAHFVSEQHKNNIIRHLNTPDAACIFNNKALTYKYFSPYYRREILEIVPSQGAAARNAFAQFIAKRQKFVAKPLGSSLGNGFRIITRNENDSTDSLYEELTRVYANRSFLVEDFVVQCVEMARPHPSSINTVRITTLLLNDRLELLHPFVRIGQGGAIVDNGGSGGIICPLDPETGRTIAACDEHVRRYDRHPQTNLPLIGFQIPRWQEAQDLVRELAFVVPDCRYVGWDLALTDNGWIVIEGNSSGQFIGWQLTLQQGFREELTALLKEIGLDYNQISRRSA